MKLAAWLRRRKQREQELDEEIRAHLGMAIRERIEHGEDPAQAEASARREFGNEPLVKEITRDMWGGRWMETILQDVRYGLRQLRRNPGMTVVAVLTLALGIGANTAIFSLVDQLLLWHIPARDANRLVKVEGIYSSSYPFFCAYRDLNQVFSGVLASSDNLVVGIRPAGSPGVEVGHVEYVSGTYFQTLGIGSAAGRVITPSDDAAPGGSPVAVLSYRYWQHRFAGDPGAVGRKLAVNTYPLEIIGVAEKGFGGLFNGDEPDAFIPIIMYPVIMPFSGSAWNSPQTSLICTVARLKPGVSMQQAQAGMQVLSSQAVEAINGAAVKAGGIARHFLKDQLRLVPAARAASFSHNQQFLDPLKALAVATALVLLIACANVANLMLARASQSCKDTAVRRALGATRGRLIRQFLTESLVLAAAGSIAGLGLAYFGVRYLAKLAILDPDLRFRLSLFVLGSCSGLTLLTSLLFGVVPALRATRVTLAESMKEGGLATPTIYRSRISKALVAVQVALSLTLLFTASLFIRTLRNLHSVNLGFQHGNIAIFDIDPTNLGFRGQRLRIFYDELLARVRGLHEVRSAALSAITPMGQRRGLPYTAQGSQRNSGYHLALSNPVSSGYFATMGIPLLLGRDFRAEDEPAATTTENPFGQLGRSGGGVDVSQLANASRVCIVDQLVARTLFGALNPVGRHLCYSEGECSREQAIEIVGVVGSAHYGKVRRPDWLGTIYEPSWSNGSEARLLLVRFAGNAAAAIAGIRRAMQEQEPNVPLLTVSMMEDYIDRGLADERLIASLSGFFGILALGLASVGLYGVMAYAVTQRTREIGIRMAMGAQRGQVLGTIFSDSIVPVVVGLVGGLVAAYFGALLVGSFLFGVESFDFESTSISVTIMLAAAFLAAAIPARRATKVDPMVALRYE